MHSLKTMLVLAFGCASLLPMAAQEAQPRLELRTTSGQTTFAMGERIALTLTLTGPDNGKYSIDTAGYDRSGRLDIDRFEVSPATGWSDPLAQYFSHGFMGGGLSSSQILTSKPASFAADLNEHIRFDQPGTYTVTATSGRVGTASKNHFPATQNLALRSNTIEIHILPATAAWQAQKLRSILETLAATAQQKGGWKPPDERTAAIADLRYLNSPASIECLAGALRESSEDQGQRLMWAAALGLSGVPDSMRETALHAMAERIDEPAFPVGAVFLGIMAGLEEGLDAGPKETATSLWPKRRPEFKMVWKMALSGLGRKQGAALAATAETLLTEAPDGESSDVKAQVAAIVASNFAALPIDRQISELQYNWDELKREPVLPELQAVIHQKPQKSDNPFYNSAELNAVVLKRWYELDPDGAVSEVAAQLAFPDAALSPRSLGSLPGGAQPQFEAGWAKELGESTDDTRQTLLAALLVRFGTGSATAEVESKLDSLVGKWACEPQAAALAYVVKFESENAVGLVNRAMKSTHDTQCYETLFATVSSFAHGAALNEAAVGALQNANPRAAADAANYLRYFGTESAKLPLLDRYREWSERWSGKPGAVDPATESGYPMSLLGQSLGEALIANQGWLADRALIAEVLSRCVGKEVCKELDELASEALLPKQNVVLGDSMQNGECRIGQYTSKSLELFEAKLAQFPAGSRFTLVASMPRNGDQLQLEKEVEAMFRKHGMTLELTAPPVAAKASAQ